MRHRARDASHMLWSRVDALVAELPAFVDPERRLISEVVRLEEMVGSDARLERGIRNYIVCLSAIAALIDSKSTLWN